MSELKELAFQIMREKGIKKGKIELNIDIDKDDFSGVVHEFLTHKVQDKKFKIRTTQDI